MLYDEMKQTKVIQDKIIVEQELVNYMAKLKEICDEAMIGYSIQQGLVEGLKNAIVDENNGRFVVDRELYKSCIEQICYSPFSDTFSLFLNDTKLALVLIERLGFLFKERNIANNKIDYEINGNYCVIEIMYEKDKYYRQHISKHIKNIISLKPQTK